MSSKFKIIVSLGFIFFFSVFNFSLAWSQNATFNVNPDYDFSGRNQIETQLLKTTNKLYFYVDKSWYQNFPQKGELDSKLYTLASDFEYKIYPFLTSLLGSEDNPGVDNDPRIVIVLEPLKDGYGGYVQSGDEYPKTQYPNSNEGQIIYLNSNLIIKADYNFLNYELAHEFTHLITLKQKPNSQTWFYEMMSEFAGQAIGVDTSQITKQRAQALLYSTEVNLKDWVNSDKDYGKIYLFALYLREQFGNQLFSEALRYPSNDGLISLDNALKRRGSSLDEAYFNWLITNLYNTCEANNTKYCYQDPNLKNFSVIAYSYYLPPQAKSLLSVTDSLRTLSAKWQKINGGLGTIKLKFTIPQGTPIKKIPYLIEDSQHKKILNFFDFSSTNIQEAYVTDMGSKNIAVYFIPYLGTNSQEGRLYFYSFEVENLGNNPSNDETLIKQLEQQIIALKQQIALLQMQIALKNTYQTNSTCSVFKRDLSYGMHSEEVKCLQQFLANLGSDIYPEKLITGYYGTLTLNAVKRYQAKYNLPQTGYFGPLTRARVNQEL